MEIINIKNNSNYLKEYIRLCSLEWGSPKSEEEMQKYVEDKEKRILTNGKVLSILGLIDNNHMIGFISLFKYEDDIEEDVTPWYATIYVKEEYRGRGYSKILNDAILEESKRLGYDKVYLKSSLKNYYEKFGAQYIKDLKNKEKLYYIDLKSRN